MSGARVLVELDGPAKMLQQGVATMAAASSPEEDAGQGVLAASALVLAGVSGADAETSMAYGAFLALLSKNILLSQGVLAPGLVTSYTIIYVMKNVIWRLVLEIQIEIKRRKFGLPRKLGKIKLSKLNPFKKRKKSNKLNIYVPRLKKRRLKIFSRKISLLLPYQKRIEIKASPMVEHIPIH